MSVIDRRRFLRCTSTGTVAAVGLGGSVGPWWTQAALAAEGQGKREGRVLVVIQLSGGNDGLNTVIPVGDEEYRKNRLTLAYDKSSVLRIDDYLGWHPSARGMADLMESGRLSIIQGVGYPQPNRSHFESMDLWHTAHAASRATGWLGRFADQRFTSETPESIYVGGGVRPLALQSRESVPLTVRELDQFRLVGGRATRDVAEEITESSNSDSNLATTIAKNLQAALKADSQLANMLRFSENTSYRGDGLGRDLKQVATMIRAGLPASVYYVTLDGFDTHANQQAAHASLLEQLGAGMKAFCDDLAGDGLLDRVLLMSFSEFGRRVKENGSRGTDHGVAGPMFIAGGNCHGGLLGSHPSLRDLDEGDLKHSIDYRSVYRTILEDWLEADAGAMIDGQYAKLNGLLG